MKKLLLALGLITSQAFAASTYTDHYNFEKPADGDEGWGGAYRLTLDEIDEQLFINASTTTDHIDDLVGAHAATAISTTVGTVCASADDVQEFLECLDTELNSIVGGGAAGLADNNNFTGANTFNGTTTFAGGTVISSNLTIGSGTGLLHLTAGVASTSAVVDADVDAAAAIARTKLASGTASHVLVNDGSGVMSSEALLALSRGGTNKSISAAAGQVVYTDADSLEVLAAGTSGQILRSAGAAAPSWSTATYPATAGTAGKILRSDGTNFVGSTALYPDTAGSSGNVLVTDGTEYAPGQVQLDSAAAVSGVLPQANGGTNTSSVFTQGSLIFQDAGSAYGADASNLWYDASDQQLGIGTNSPATNLDVDGDLALRTGASNASTGTLNNVDIAGKSLFKFTNNTGPTVTGFDGGVNGKLLVVIYTGSGTMTLANNSGSSDADNRIITGTAGNVELASGASITLWYDSANSLWRLVGAVAGASGSDTISGSRGSPNSITAAGGITVSGTRDNLIYVTGDGGVPIDITANPQISDGAADGQEACVRGRSNSATVILENGNGLVMNGPVELGADDEACFKWDTTDWVETGGNLK